MLISEKLPSQLKAVPQFVLKVVNDLKALSLSEKEIFNIRLSLNEALINAIKHGNKLNPDLSVAVKIQTQGDYLTIEIKDEGGGFDFNHLPDPTRQENLLKTAGRGVFLIRNLMDRVDFFDQGRGIKMVKLLKDSEGGRK